MKDRFIQYRSSLRSYLRKRGAIIDVRAKTIMIDRDQLTFKESKRLDELLKWGYTMVESENSSVEYPLERLQDDQESFIGFADEIIFMNKLEQLNSKNNDYSN